MSNKSVFGSISVGSGTRFKTKPASGAAPASFNQAKSMPQSFSGLRSGYQFEIEYEAAQSAPVDGSDAALRALSPFIIQVEPPLVYANAGVIPGGDKKKDPGALIEASGGGNPFASARQNLQSSTIKGMDRAGTQRSVEQYIGANAVKYGTSGSDLKEQTSPGGNRPGIPSLADLNTAVDIALQLKSVLETPPLILLINPTTLSLNRSKIQQFQDRTRHGFVFHAWGEEQPTLSAEIRCGAFYTAGKGVSWASKRDSASWNNMMALLHFYRNNGYIHDTVTGSFAHHMVGALSIHYDGWIYYGNMQSLSWSFEESVQNGGITISLEFVVSTMLAP